MTGLSLTVDLPPSLNHAYQPTAGGGRRLTRDAASYRDGVGWQTREAALLTGWRPAPDCWLALDVTLTMRHVRRGDVDNLSKLLVDGITRAIHVDDSRVIDLRVRKRLGTPERADVHIREATR